MDVVAQRSNLRPSKSGLHYYSAFNLAIASELALPELEEIAPCDPDLSFRLAGDLGPEAVVTDIPSLELQAGRLVLFFRGVGRFVVDVAAATVEVETVAGDVQLARLPLLGPVVACFLHLKGQLVLHGSAVELSSQAVAFLGRKGAGKSTTAAMMIEAGAPLLTDDLLACEVIGGEVQCATSFPQCRLNPDAKAEIGLNTGQIVGQPHPLFSKTQVRLPRVDRPLTPLKGICILDRGERFALSRLEPPLALRAILENGYVARYGAMLLPAERHAGYFKDCARLVGAVPVYRLETPSTLPQLREMIPDLMAAF